ncbi:CRISPR-associated endoribonuclease Cas6 [Streptomyces avicenniae]|uniref:CRISPR-associated endoribonuclease Cas6 n=1 Tax=Streptomyces avicenniae TaxID=500153 RepID=UPI001CBA68B2|nr:CRISPR-associated endoribonuclease Cas6 [Streptomyces avicenniae]
MGSLPWEDVHGPARAVVYGLLSSENPVLAKSLHDEGWNGQPLKPVGGTSPMFRGAPRRKGVYTTSKDGSVWFGSPVPEIAAVLVTALASCQTITWGSARLRVQGFSLDVVPNASDGPVQLESVTPTVVKHENRYVLPGEPHYLDRLTHNLHHKADILGLPRPEDVHVLDAGPRRRFTVSGAPRIGAQVRIGMEADARFVDALRSWGLGLDTVQGFGWLR